MISEDTICDYIKGQNVLVLGNGPSDAEPYDYDKVIRFGVGLNGGPCDIWVANFMTRGGCYIENGTFYRKNRGHSAKVPITLFPFQYIFRLSQDQQDYPEDWKQHTCFVHRDKWMEIRRELYHQPLTGTMFLYWLLNFGPKNIKINVAGFDGFESNNIYHNLGPTRIHRLDKDKDMFNNWVKEKRFNWIR